MNPRADPLHRVRSALGERVQTQRDGWPDVIPEGLDASLVLLRHGETEFIVQGRFQGHAETPLSPLGRRQAELAGRRLVAPGEPPALPIAPNPPLEIAHSPLRRTAEVAGIVGAAYAAAGVDVPVRPEPGLKEIGQGEWEGLHRTEIETRYAAELAGWRRRPHEIAAPNGESLDEVQQRLRPGLARILASLAEGRTPGTIDRPVVIDGRPGAGDEPWALLVGHDGIFKVVLLTLFGLPLERFWLFPFALAGLTVVEFVAGRPRLRAHNLVDHLAPLAVQEARSEDEAAERERSGAL